MISLRNLLLATAFAVAAPSLAAAADLSAPAPAAIPAAASESIFDVSFGVTLTSDYVSRGITQTNGGPAIQPWVELNIWKLYVGAWFSNVDFDYVGTPDWETDLSIGIRPEFGPLSLDLGYVRYYYDGDDCCGEAYAKAKWAATDSFTVGAQFFIDTEDTDYTYVEANASYALPHDFSVSGAVGMRNTPGDEYLTWNAGVSYTWNSLTFDVRYHDSDLTTGECGGDYCDARVVASVSFASSLKSLGILK